MHSIFVNAFVTLVICPVVAMTVARFRLKHFPEFYFEGWSVRTTGISWLIELGLCSVSLIVFLASLYIDGKTSYAVSYSMLFTTSSVICPFIVLMKKRSNELRRQHRDDVHITWSTASSRTDLGEPEIIGSCGQKTPSGIQH